MLKQGWSLLFEPGNQTDQVAFQLSYCKGAQGRCIFLWRTGSILRIYLCKVDLIYVRVDSIILYNLRYYGSLARKRGKSCKVFSGLVKFFNRIKFLSVRLRKFKRCPSSVSSKSIRAFPAQTKLILCPSLPNPASFHYNSQIDLNGLGTVQPVSERLLSQSILIEVKIQEVGCQMNRILFSGKIFPNYLFVQSEVAGRSGATTDNNKLSE